MAWAEKILVLKRNDSSFTSNRDKLFKLISIASEIIFFWFNYSVYKRNVAKLNRFIVKSKI